VEKINKKPAKFAGFLFIKNIYYFCASLNPKIP